MPNLANKNQCTGCTACVSICPLQCIQMQEDSEGFLYPTMKKDSTCITCGACEKVCPIMNDMQKNTEKTKAYAALSKNDSLRIESSSGGVFSELAKLVLQVGGIIYGASYDKDYKVNHIGIENINLLRKLRGAKYSQSYVMSIFPKIKEHLESGRQVLFSGTPCQVGGLKAYLKRDYDNLICIDFVCHGVPSPLVWKKYVEYRAHIDDNSNAPEYINLRNKETGWSRYSYTVEFAYSRKKRYLSKNTEDPFMKLFVNNYILRRSCSECHFKGYSRAADITLGDFWGIWDMIPEMDDNKGTSLVLIHSKKGEDLFRTASDNIKNKPVTLEQASMMNISLLKSSVSQPSRDKVLCEIIQNGFESMEKILNNINNKEEFSELLSLNNINQQVRLSFSKRLRSVLHRILHK